MAVIAWIAMFGTNQLHTNNTGGSSLRTGKKGRAGGRWQNSSCPTSKHVYLNTLYDKYLKVEWDRIRSSKTESDFNNFCLNTLNYGCIICFSVLSVHKKQMDNWSAG